MSTEALNNRVQAVRDEAASIIGSYRNHRESILQDRLLSPEGKEEQLAGIYASTSARAQQLAAKEDKLLADHLETLQRSLVTQLGSGSSDIIAMRDAEDRADRLTKKEEASRVLERAINGNDRSLAHAVLRRAADEGWRDVVAQAEAAYPAAGETLRDIQEVQSAINSTGALIFRAMSYSVSK